MVERICEYFRDCPIFEKFSLESTKNVYIILYCKGSKMEECARRKLRKEGKEVPLNLLPDGSTMKI